MKKMIFMLIVSAISVSAHAQLSHTKWKGAIKGDAPQKATFAFAKDTAVLYGADGSVLESMIYTVKDNVLTLKKISGQSDCDAVTVGKYTFDLRNGALTLVLKSDACADRSSAFDKTSWAKAKG